MAQNINNGGAIQTSIRNRALRGKAGLLAFASNKLNDVDTFVNADPQSRWTRQLTVATFSDGAEYVFVIGDATIRYTAVTADTNAAGVAAKLKTAIESNPVAGGYVTVERSSAVLTLTARWVGFDVPMATADAKLTLGAATGAVDAASIEFGRVVFYGGAAVNRGNKRARLAASALLVKDSYALTPVVANTTAYPVTLIAPSGAVFTPSYTSDGTATAKEICDNVNTAIAAVAEFIAAGGAVADNDAVVTVTVPFGWRVEVTNVWGVAFTEGADVDDMIAGIALFTNANTSDVFSGDVQNAYAPNSAMDVLTGNGGVFVESTESTSRLDPVYVELSGDDAGKLFKESSATRVRSRRLRWYEDNDGSEGVAIVELIAA